MKFKKKNIIFDVFFEIALIFPKSLNPQNLTKNNHRRK